MQKHSQQCISNERWHEPAVVEPEPVLIEHLVDVTIQCLQRNFNTCSNNSQTAIDTGFDFPLLFDSNCGQRYWKKKLVHYCETWINHHPVSVHVCVASTHWQSGQWNYSLTFYSLYWCSVRVYVFCLFVCLFVFASWRRGLHNRLSRHVGSCIPSWDNRWNCTVWLT